jgi:predicted kinase
MCPSYPFRPLRMLSPGPTGIAGYVGGRQVSVDGPLRLPPWAGMPAVLVLVGTSASGKTTLRRELVSAGLPGDQVVSLDDLRRRARAWDRARGRPERDLHDYSALAVRLAARRCDALAAFGAGYVADATHLRRRDRRLHVTVAAETGLEARAVLTPAEPVEVLLERNLRRPADEAVPVDVLLRQAHRRSLLSADRLLAEGFASVVEAGVPPERGA